MAAVIGAVVTVAPAKCCAQNSALSAAVVAVWVSAAVVAVWVAAAVVAVWVAAKTSSQKAAGWPVVPAGVAPV